MGKIPNPAAEAKKMKESIRVAQGIAKQQIAKPPAEKMASRRTKALGNTVKGVGAVMGVKAQHRFSDKAGSALTRAESAPKQTQVKQQKFERQPKATKGFSHDNPHNGW